MKSENCTKIHTKIELIESYFIDLIGQLSHIAILRLHRILVFDVSRVILSIFILFPITSFDSNS